MSDRRLSDFTGSSKPQIGITTRILPDVMTGKPTVYATAKTLAQTNERTERQIVRLATAHAFGTVQIIGKANRLWIHVEEANAYFAAHPYIPRGPKGQTNGGRKQP